MRVRRTMMMSIVVAACAGPAPSPGPDSAARAPAESEEAADFRMICDEATRAVRVENKDERGTIFATAVYKKLRTTAVRETLDAAGTVSDSERLSFLRGAAEELKVEGWDCPALAELYGPQVKWEQLESDVK